MFHAQQRYHKCVVRDLSLLARPDRLRHAIASPFLQHVRAQELGGGAISSSEEIALALHPKKTEREGSREGAIFLRLRKKRFEVIVTVILLAALHLPDQIGGWPFLTTRQHLFAFPR